MGAGLAFGFGLTEPLLLMATAGPLDLFFDIANEEIVASFTNQGPFTLPSWYHQNAKDLRATFLRLNTTGAFGSPYTKVPATGLSFSAKLFTSDGATVLASQITWTVNATDANALDGVLDLNTAAMATAFTSGSTTSITAILEFKMTETSGGTTTWQRTVTIKRQYDVVGSPVAVAPDTYLTEAQSDARYAKYAGNGAGASITLLSAAGTYQVIISVNDDGTFHADVI